MNVSEREREKNDTLIRYSPVIKSVESVLRPKRWWEGYVTEVGFAPGMKDRGSY